MYQPTEHQLSAFVNDYMYLRTSRKLPTSKLKVALQYSIAKWQAIVNFIEDGALIEGCGHDDTCALCQYYWGREDHCALCPIGGSCEETPYKEFCFAHDAESSLGAAKKEVRFLQGLYKERYG